MKASCVAVLLFAVAVVASHADETNLTLTVDGVTYSNVTFRTVTSSTVSIFHKTGIATVPLAKLPPDLQQRFGYDPQKAAERQKAEQQRAKAEQQKAEMGKLSKTMIEEPLKVGTIGISYGERLTVVQIVSTNEMLASVYTRKMMFDSFGAPIWGNDAYGNKTLAVTPKAHLVWVKGISTAELADNAEILRNIVFKVTGTKTYETADAGIRTLFVLEPLTSVNSP